MNNKQLLNEAEYLLKKTVDRGGCYPPRPQRCCFVNLNLSLFRSSRCRRRCWSSLSTHLRCFTWYSYRCYTPDIVIKFILPLCLKTWILAPESLAPKMREVWLSSSLMIKSPFPTRAGIFAELVANPIPNTIAAGLLTNRATRPSSSLWIARVPDNKNLNITQITKKGKREGS